MEHRWGQRVSVNRRIRLACRPYAIGSGWLRDVSTSGAYLETKLRLPLLAQVAVELEPLADGVQHLTACVVRSDDKGLGIEWAELAPASIVALLAVAPKDGATILQTVATPTSRCAVS